MHYVLPLNQGGIAVLLGAGSRVQDVGSLTSGLAALAQPFKLRLCRAGHESQLRDYSSNVVLIEPLATISAVEDFLWMRVYRSPSSASQAGGEARGRSPGAAAAAGGPGTAGAGGRGSARAAAAAELQVCTPYFFYNMESYVTWRWFLATCHSSLLSKKQLQRGHNDSRCPVFMSASHIEVCLTFILLWNISCQSCDEVFNYGILRRLQQKQQ